MTAVTRSKSPRRKPLPMPPLPPSREHQILLPAAKRLGLHPFDIPMLRNTVPYNGRRSCMRCRWCVGFACEVNARTGTHNTVIPAALATGNCELRTECVTKEILLDARARATGVVYFDARDRLQQQTADLVIVCGGAVESARLLLNTKHGLFPNGLGNRYDQVGRNLQSHSYPGATGLFEYDTLRRSWARRIHRDLRLQPRQRRIGRRRHAGQRVHPPALPVHDASPAMGPPVGPET